MADIFAVSATILGVIQFTSNVVDVLKMLRDVDHVKFDQLYWLTVANRERTIAWANVTRGAGRPIPPENVDKVEGLLQQMLQYYDEIESMLKPVYSHVGKKTTVRVLLHRMKFSFEGFDKIKSYLDAIDAMNQALERIAPPLPAYPEQPVKIYQPSSSIDISVPADPETTAVELLATTLTQESERPKPALLPRDASLESMYGLCLSIIRSLITRNKCESHEACFINLELWGTGLFGSDVTSMDRLFATDTEKNTKLRKIITKCLVHISVDLGWFNCIDGHYSLRLILIYRAIT
jgi:hypothetical protein